MMEEIFGEANHFPLEPGKGQGEVARVLQSLTDSDLLLGHF